MQKPPPPPEIYFLNGVNAHVLYTVKLCACVFTKHITKLSSMAGYQPWEEIRQDSNQCYNYVFFILGFKIIMYLK